MKVMEFIEKLYDLPKDAKMVLNDGDYTELEMKMLMLEKAHTVESIFKFHIDMIAKWQLIPDHKMSIMGRYVKDIIFHEDRFKSRRFYEIVIEK